MANDVLGDPGGGSEEEGDTEEAQPSGAAGPASEVAEDADAEEDCEETKVFPDPGMPSQSEIDEHNATHHPYRSWCEFCVKARGEGEHHTAGPVSGVPVIAFDHLFITNG